MLEWRQVVSNQYKYSTMRHSYDVIEIDNHVIFNILQNIYFWEFYIFVYQVGLKHAKPNIGKIFKTHIILITKYLIVKRFIFYQKWLILNKNF